MALNAKLALLLTLFLSVASNGYSSLQENNASDDELGGRLSSVPSKDIWTKVDSSFKSGFVIGYVFSAVSILTIYLSYCVPWARLNKRKRNKVMMKTPMMTSLMERQEKKRKEADIQISSLDQMLIARISFDELQKATNSFDRGKVIGVGKTGTVYKAAHPHLRFTAVKRLFDLKHLEKQFLSELTILGKFTHKNIVPLLGFCLESRERLLVYQYMPNGNLYDWLHPVKGEPKIMEWHFRVNIAAGIARGLAWLHSHNTLQLAHLNLSSRCILLDKNFEPRISNFGRAMHIMTSNARIFMANIEMSEWDLTKRDVHQLGVLLLELITGEDPFNNSDFYHSLEGKLGQNNCLLSTVSAALYCAVDKSLLGQGFDREVLYFLKVACNCIQPVPNRRPTMVEVYKMLMAIKNTHPDILG
ncbi:hypothetical protein POTOM_054458 [Populus tomentosa]|uniref:Protein kinase domain-containing protein n=1 Tax=Populus tomentosa TaxID=118781 RepID=A0A8X7Y0H3_POPTO|nr:hypothetical protein POTOM_054458 [Populus tomentosa]